MSDKLRFLVTAQSWVAGKLREAGEIVELTEAEAKYETGIARETAPKAARKSKKSAAAK
ncbi:MAG: hypothetical protein AAF401_09695 [Pseudomonadota bacterium]